MTARRMISTASARPHVAGAAALLLAVLCMPAHQAGATAALAVGTGPIATAEGNAGALLGAVDLSGNGPYDLLLGLDTLVPYTAHNTEGVPQYGPSQALTKAVYLDPLADDSGLVLSVPFAPSDAAWVRIAVAAGRLYTYETSDHISVDVLFDDGSSQTLGSFRGNTAGAAGALAYDKDGDGVGDDIPLDVAFRSYSFPIPAGEWPIRVRVRIDVDDNEEVAVDNVQLVAARGTEAEVIAQCSFEDVDGEWAFETNINAASITALTGTYRGATFAGDGFNDYVAIHPTNSNLYSPTNIDLGFNNQEGIGFLLAEDSSRDGLPPEVSLTFAPVTLPAIPFADTRRKTNWSSAFVLEGVAAPGGGLELQPGSDSVGYSATSTVPISSTSQTWMAWVRADSYEIGSFTTTHPHGIINAYAGTSMSAVLRLSSGAVQAGWYDGERFILSTTNDTVPTGEWLHIATSSDGINPPRIFVNGTEWGTTVSAGDPTSRPLHANEFRVGHQSTSGNVRVLDGAIRDVRIYDRTLADNEIAAVAQAGEDIYAMADTRDMRPGAVVRMQGGSIVALATQGSTLLSFTFDDQRGGFVQTARFPLSTILPVHALSASAADSDSLDIHLATHGNADYLPHGKPLYDPDFIPYDGAGIWLGGMPQDDIYHLSLGLEPNPAINNQPVLVSTQDGRVLFETTGLAAARPASTEGIIMGGVLGTIEFRPITAQGSELGGRQYAWLTDGSLLLHHSSSARPIAMSQPDEAGTTDLVVQSISGIDFYRSTGTNASDGGPLFEEPVQLVQDGAVLTFGHGAAITGADLDGDGLVDLVAGNAAGQLLISRQIGPLQFAPPEQVDVNGRAFRYEAGYRGSIQGPAQSRLGYTSPTLFDWDGDGAVDILLSNISGDYFVLLRDTSSPDISFKKARPLFMDGLEFHTTWRNQPAVSDWNGSRTPGIVTFDHDDRLRIYDRYDAFNLQPGELLRLEDDSVISANVFASSGTGRIRLQLVDWDDDGLLDLLAGTTPESALPSPATGLPYTSPAIQGSTVLFLRNVASNAEPRFAAPQVIDLNDQTLDFDSAGASPFAAGAFQGDLELLVAPASGIVHFWTIVGETSGFDRFFIH